MKRSGRASIVVIGAVAILVAVIALFLLAGESPSGVATKFLIALAKGDSKELSNLSFMEGVSQEELAKKWDETHEVTKHWIFAFSIKDSIQQDSNTATVKLSWVKNLANPGSYDENFELPLQKKDGKWKVDVRGISREMYPALPR